MTFEESCGFTFHIRVPQSNSVVCAARDDDVQVLVEVKAVYTLHDKINFNISYNNFRV